MNKKELAIILSKLNPIPSPKASLEQYQTDSELAAHLVWIAYLSQDVSERDIADLGCGNGILGIACLVLGAKKVYFIDVSKDSLEIAKKNLAIVEKSLGVKLNAEFSLKSVDEIKVIVDTVIQNPPFGIQKGHADKHFLEKAMQISPTIYTIHKAGNDSFIYKLASENDFSIISVTEVDFPLRKSQFYHKKRTYNVKVAIYKLKRNI